MFQLIYASTATRSLKESELRSLVKRARKRNDTCGITGVLVHRNGSFLHILEGAEEDVRALYERIRDDERHRWVTLLKATPVKQRDFPDAPLAFRDHSLAGARPQPLQGLAQGGEGPAHETLVRFQRAKDRPNENPVPDLGEGGNASEAAAS